jgi:hypothetical protein
MPSLSSTIMEQLKANNTIVFQEAKILEFGTTNQRSRWAADVLPEDELLALARGELFKGLEHVPRWHGRDVRKELRDRIDVKHRKARKDGCHVMPEFDVTVLGDLSAEEWEVHESIKGYAALLQATEMLKAENREITLQWFTHWATCPACEQEVWCSGVKVTIPWAGRSLVREYRL